MVKKLENAKKRVEKDKEVNFNSFINEVEAQKGKHIFNETADELLNKVNFIINNL